MIISIDLDRLTELKQEAGSFLLNPEAEKAWEELLDLQEQVNNAVEAGKKALGDAGMDIDPGFKGVVGDNVRCVYRKFGKKYSIGEDANPEFLYTKEYTNVDAKKVDEHFKNTGELPHGIDMPEREAKMSISRKKHA
jgi:hypothetical protein